MTKESVIYDIIAIIKISPTSFIPGRNIHQKIADLQAHDIVSFVGSRSSPTGQVSFTVRARVRGLECSTSNSPVA